MLRQGFGQSPVKHIKRIPRKVFRVFRTGFVKFKLSHYGKGFFQKQVLFRHKQGFPLCRARHALIQNIICCQNVLRKNPRHQRFRPQRDTGKCHILCLTCRQFHRNRVKRRTVGIKRYCSFTAFFPIIFHTGQRKQTVLLFPAGKQGQSGIFAAAVQNGFQ